VSTGLRVLQGLSPPSPGFEDDASTGFLDDSGSVRL
jgi:hypothetical protein